MQTKVVRAVRRHSAVGLTERKRAEIARLACLWNAVRRQYVSAYWAPRYAMAVVHDPRGLREAERRAGRLHHTGLQSNHCKTAFENALAMVRGGWGQAIGRTERQLGRAAALTADERSWMLEVLASPEHLQNCLNGKTPALDVAGDARRLARKLRRMLRHNRGRQPRLRGSNSFEIDTNLYRIFERPGDRFFRGAWLALTSSRPRDRINIPLSGRGVRDFVARTAQPNSRPGLRVEVGERITFHLIQRVDVLVRASGTEAGIDKGVRTLLTLSTGSPETAEQFGGEAIKLIESVAERRVERARNRRRLKSYERSIRNSRPRTAGRIRRRNLGVGRQRNCFERENGCLRTQLGRAVNALFIAHPDVKTLHVEGLNFRGRRLSRRVNRWLNVWLKGRLHRALAYKAQLHGVQLNVVNPAWTSLTCTRCGYPSRTNRKGDSFVCRSCGYSGSADAVAATNVLRRGSDRVITRWTRKDDVYRILESRWRSALSDGAWGLSRIEVSETAANIPSSGSHSTSVFQLRKRPHTSVHAPPGPK